MSPAPMMVWLIIALILYNKCIIPLIPGPIYFKTPRICGLFSVHCERLTKQVNFLIDEGVNTGNGANCVIS